MEHCNRSHCSQAKTKAIKNQDIHCNIQSLPQKTAHFSTLGMRGGLGKQYIEPLLKFLVKRVFSPYLDCLVLQEVSKYVLIECFCLNQFISETSRHCSRNSRVLVSWLHWCQSACALRFNCLIKGACISYFPHRKLREPSPGYSPE